MSSPAAAPKTAGRKSTKTTTTAAAPAPVAAPAPASVPVAAPAPAPVPVAAPAPVAPTTDVTERTEVTVDSLTKAYESLLEEHTTLRKLVAKNDSAMRAFKATLARGLKNAAKKGGRKNKSKDASAEDKPKKETVFNRPVAVSSELTKFLKLADGSTICRSDVTKRICTYAKEKGLMTGKTINADAPLRKVLGLKDGDSLTILNLQKYLSPHYPKAAVANTVSA